jgi:hypothetical protein
VKCERCGWDESGQKPHEMRLENWPDHLPDPPPLPEINVHPAGTCPSPYRINDEVFWTPEGGDDLPPLVVTFLGLKEFYGPDFILEDGIWVQQQPAKPLKAIVQVREGSLLEAHRRCFPALRVVEEHYVVLFDVLTLPTLWPVVFP